ncbi:MAG: asparaginase domain-containing protein [Lachnospiraceae bacterium]|nr:asparaginase domain-containing protein [Lachnospiraceae bacterium]
MQKHILVLFTGGTIGCEKEDEKIALGPKSPTRLFDYYKEYGKNEVCFSSRTPFTMLSENNDGEALTKICSAVQEALREDVDGVIVTHGSDTLQYTGAALSLALGALKKSVVLVASNYVLSDERANGYDNFVAAVETICMDLQQDVYISYRNQDGIARIYKANRVLPHEYNSDELHCIGSPALFFEHGKCIRTIPELTNKTQRTGSGLPLPLTKQSPVLYLKVYPGVQFFGVPDDSKVVLLETYHSGTLPDDGAMRKWLKMLEEQNIPVFICGTGNRDYYASVLGWKDQIHVLPEISPVVAYIKLWMLCELCKDGAGKMDVSRLVQEMFTNISGEYIEYDVL